MTLSVYFAFVAASLVLAVAPGPDGAATKCELCLQNACGAPACAAGCPNNAIVYEDREVSA